MVPAIGDRSVVGSAPITAIGVRSVVGSAPVVNCTGAARAVGGGCGGDTARPVNICGCLFTGAALNKTGGVAGAFGTSHWVPKEFKPDQYQDPAFGGGMIIPGIALGGGMIIPGSVAGAFGASLWQKPDQIDRRSLALLCADGAPFATGNCFGILLGLGFFRQGGVSSGMMRSDTQ